MPVDAQPNGAELAALAAMVRKVLLASEVEKRSTEQSATSGADNHLLWTRLIQLDVPGLLVPVRYGGSGVSLSVIASVLEETGRTLECSPLLGSSVIATLLITTLGDETDFAAHLPPLAAGDARAAVAFGAGAGMWSRAGVATTATLDRGTWRLTGEYKHVVDGDIASMFVVLATGPSGVAAFVVDPSAAGVSTRTHTTLDGTRTGVVLTLASAPAQPLGDPGDSRWEAIRRVRDAACLGLAAEQVGGTARCLELALEHARTRSQFGRPIGSFQAVKHRCADIYLKLLGSRATLAAGLDAFCANDFAESRLLASVAQAHCSEAYLFAARNALQIYGASGYTWDYPLHRHLKRAKSSEYLLGSPLDHRRHLARLLSLDAEVVS